MIDVACALEYLHHGCSSPVIHCDLKPSNVLLDEDMVAHLSNNGISKLLCEDQDVCTLRYKELSSGVVAKSFKHPVNSSDMISIQHQSMESCEQKDEIFPQSIANGLCLLRKKKRSWKITYCVSTVRRINEFYRWPGDIWELPMFLKHAMDSKDSDLNSSSTPSEGAEDELKAAAQDIASYQVSFLGCSFWVVLSRDGKIVEIQPTNRIAENQWAANPLVKELYGKKKFVPGLIERGRKMITRPNDVVILELLMSSNPQS
ncbi:hypothetical protein CQW23_33168 [Capsicum baccatum]|uniref:Protein kinase domain-containing protein n=1 Tax=Capsicum baccatum TaxID=33114 RepID=A0A2G2V2M6_CAPBA|nr:hypothetical protein CQW23_33168 [Capsicum baccatum]